MTHPHPTKPRSPGAWLTLLTGLASVAAGATLAWSLTGVDPGGGIRTPIGLPAGSGATVGFASAKADPPTASICLYDALAQLREVSDGRAQRHQRSRPACQRG